MTTPVDATAIPPIRRAEAVDLGREEYRRLVAFLRELDPADWDRPTECDPWAVADLVAHLLGAAEGNARLREFVHQGRLGMPLARREGRDIVDGVNAVQIRERATLSPAELVERLEQVAGPSLAARARCPRLLRLMPMPVPHLGWRTLGYLHDRVYNRDVWLHRIDLGRATNRPVALTPEHDGRLIADVVGDWARSHGRPFELHLTGPAGGRYRVGAGGEEHELDTIEFARMLSGRVSGQGLLALPVVF
jgi:uncharacterized protein (TIGR03083 family)